MIVHVRHSMTLGVSLCIIANFEDDNLYVDEPLAEDDDVETRLYYDGIRGPACKSEFCAWAFVVYDFNFCSGYYFSSAHGTGEQTIDDLACDVFERRRVSDDNKTSVTMLNWCQQAW